MGPYKTEIQKEACYQNFRSPARAWPWCKHRGFLCTTGEKLQRPQWGKLSWNKNMPCTTQASSRLKIIFILIWTQKNKALHLYTGPMHRNMIYEQRELQWSSDKAVGRVICPSHTLRVLQYKSTSRFSFKRNSKLGLAQFQTQLSGFVLLYCLPLPFCKCWFEDKRSNHK